MAGITFRTAIDANFVKVNEYIHHRLPLFKALQATNALMSPRVGGRCVISVVVSS